MQQVIQVLRSCCLSPHGPVHINNVGLFGGLDNLLGVGHSGRYGFFDNHMLASLNGPKDPRQSRSGGDAQVHGIYRVIRARFFHCTKRWHVVLRAKGLRLFHVTSSDKHELSPRASVNGDGIFPGNQPRADKGKACLLIWAVVTTVRHHGVLVAFRLINGVTHRLCCWFYASVRLGSNRSREKPNLKGSIHNNSAIDRVALVVQRTISFCDLRN
mmetsp:Transcript_4276/g.11668  ORF Transcript_4276/g.11668 Transcript_4276/m.11668 type:complete len:214 (-) Transcript_4276:89-730(-)